MKRVVGEEFKKIRPYFELAGQAAVMATCLRAKCGAVIIKDGNVVGKGFNSPPLNDERRRTCEKKWDYSLKPKYDKTCCIHAEWRAIITACKNSANKLSGATLYFMRVDNTGGYIDAGVPYCTTCSRLAMEAGICRFALWNHGGADIYSAVEYDQASYDYYQK